MSEIWPTIIEQDLRLVFFAGAMLGCLFMAVAVMLVPSFARRQWAPRRREPAVTVLIPLHGDGPGLFENLAAFCEQDYGGEVQLLLGVADPSDSAICVVRRLQLAFPGRQIELLVNTHAAGSNPKISNLMGMSSRIQHEIIVLVDSDIRVERAHHAAPSPAPISGFPPAAFARSSRAWPSTVISCPASWSECVSNSHDRVSDRPLRWAGIRLPQSVASKQSQTALPTITRSGMR